MFGIPEYREGIPEYMGPWNRLVKVRNVLRPDGKYGVAVVTGEPDTWFSVPARMTIGGRKVSGSLSTSDMGSVRYLGSDARGYEFANSDETLSLRIWIFTPRKGEDE